MTKHKKLRSGKLRGSPKYKIWFPSKALIDTVCFDKTDRGLSNLAERMGVSIAVVKRLVQPDYLIRESTADKYAIKLGYHPMTIWDDWFSEGSKCPMGFVISSRFNPFFNFGFFFSGQRNFRSRGRHLLRFIRRYYAQI